MMDIRTGIMAGAMLALASLATTTAEARQSTSKEAAAKPAAEGRDAEATLDKARRAMDEGKAETAQQLADAVLTSGNADARNTARALAIRGEAHLNQGRAVQAAADLDSALWVKGGLAGRDRELAIAARSKAMQSGGIANAPAPVVRAAAPPPAVVAPAARSMPTRPAPPETIRSTELPPPRPIKQPSAWSSAVEATPSPSPTRIAPQRYETATSNAAPSSWSAAPRTAHAAAPDHGPSEPPASSGGSGGIAGFFSNLFGGDQSASPAATGAVSSTTITPPSPRAPAVSSFAPQRSTPEPRRSPVASPPPHPAPVRAAAMVSPAASAPIPSAPSASSDEGMYRLQLAAVRTKAEAEAMAQKIQTEERQLVGSRTVEVVEDVYGNMGRFYRVRIGPFQEPTRALSVCASLRDRRMDCMVLDR